ncbi:hypothetical protein CRG86_013055 [Photobacterium leiognathi]|nr:hypothetical protein CRG86_013055 [Photobacterium leiognathi]
MKFISIVLLMILLPFRVMSMEQGTEVNWRDYDNMVQIRGYDAQGRLKLCTGTTISGRFILTAAHCIKNLRSGELVTKRGNSNIPFALNYIDPTDNEVESTGDIALIKLINGTRTVKHKNINFFPDLTQNRVRSGQRVRVFGMGGSTPVKLEFIWMITSNSLWNTQINGMPIYSGGTSFGDSGGAWLNYDNEIIAPHSHTLDTINTESASNLYFARDFLLQTINGWHFPTLIDVPKHQRIDITVQSLHVSSTVDQAYTSGDVIIIGGTCRLFTTIKPFQTCTYGVLSCGKPGKIHLGNGQRILINRS